MPYQSTLALTLGWRAWTGVETVLRWVAQPLHRRSAIIIKTANATMMERHDRMPVTVEPADWVEAPAA